jgi:hypothetical protein
VVSRFRERLSSEIDSLGTENAPAAQAPTRSVALAARQEVKERFSLDILTTEGDRVSIRFKSVDVTELAAASASNENGSVQVSEASVISRGRFSVEVNGELNDTERAAIGELLDQVDGIAGDFFGGDVQAAFAAASRVGLESDALSAFSLRLSYSKSLAVAQAYAATAAASAAPAPSAPSAPEPAVTPPNENQPSAVSTLPESTAATVPDDSPAPSPTSARQTIASFTKNVLARLSTAGENSSATFSMRWKLDFLITAISSVTPAQDPDAQTAVRGLADALKA